MSDLIIKNAKVCIDNIIQSVEIATENGKISKIGKIVSTKEFDNVINAKGKLVLPGAIDVHVHFRDPGMTKKEDWFTGSCSAASGGVTTVIEHPNTIPPTIESESFKLKLKRAKSSIVDYGINGGVSSNNFSYLKDLWELGVCAFGEIFLANSTASLNINYNELNKALGIIENLGAVACIHAEDGNIIKNLSSMFKGNLEPNIYSKLRPVLCEKVAIENTIKVSGNSKLHFCHISSADGLEVIKKAKSKTQNITCEVAPHHLFLSVKDLKHLGSFGKMNPPLRDFYSQKCLWDGLNDGSVDIIASDHAPHLENEKLTDIMSAPAGVPGVETMIPLMMMAIKQNRLSLGRLIEVACSTPAKIFNMNKGVLASGYDADMIIMGEPIEIKKEKLYSKAGWTPYNNMSGIFPDITISRGEIICEDREIIVKKGRGKFIVGKGDNKLKLTEIEE